MKVAIPKDGNLVSSHFGQSEGFLILKIENHKIIYTKTIMNGGLKGCELARLLSEYNVDTIIVGGIGEDAKNNIEKYNIKVLLGANGNIDKIIKEYVEGYLLLNNEVCNENQDNGHGNEEEQN